MKKDKDIKEETSRIIESMSTTDIPLVAYLRYKGYTVQAVTPVGFNKSTFTFKDVDKKDLDNFNSDLATVEPKMYASIMSQQIRAAKRVGNE